MLYRYASLDYMMDLDRMLLQVINGPSIPELEKALAASYEKVMHGRYPVHGDPQRWQRDVRGLLTEMRELLRLDIADRSGGRYRSGRLDHFFTQVGRADAYDSYRMADEYHVCAHFVGKYISQVDDILVEHRRRHAVSDHWFAYHYADFLSDRARIPKFRVRTDIVARTDEVPSRAGVYISQDDPHAAPQFAWPDSDHGRLTDSCTFSEIGLAALSAIGRDGLWFDQNKMYEFFVSARMTHPFSKHEPGEATVASSIVSSVAHAERPCSWYFVEIEQDDFEDSAQEWHRNLISQPGQGRLSAGDCCQFEGKYFAMTRPSSEQYFQIGDIAPDLELRHNQTYWVRRDEPHTPVNAPGQASPPTIAETWSQLRKWLRKH